MRNKVSLGYYGSKLFITKLMEQRELRTLIVTQAHPEAFLAKVPETSFIRLERGATSRKRVR
jgi:hypothetical protein